MLGLEILQILPFMNTSFYLTFFAGVSYSFHNSVLKESTGAHPELKCNCLHV